MGLLDLLSPKRHDPEPHAAAPAADVGELLFPTKALKKLLTTLSSRESPALVDLGPVVGSNVSFFGEQLGCKLFVEDLYAELERQTRAGTLDTFPQWISKRFTQADASIDGIICWDIVDYLTRPAAQALADQLTRILRPEGALFAFFGNTIARERQYIKYIVGDEANLKHRPYPASCGRQPVLANRDIIRLFSGLRVSDSFLMKNNVREMLFRKPTYETR